MYEFVREQQAIEREARPMEREERDEEIPIRGRRKKSQKDLKRARYVSRKSDVKETLSHADVKRKLVAKAKVYQSGRLFQDDKDDLDSYLD